MGTKITKICDICGKEYDERDYLPIQFSNFSKDAIRYRGELQFRYSTDHPILGVDTVKMFDYDLCPLCASYFMKELKILP